MKKAIIAIGAAGLMATACASDPYYGGGPNETVRQGAAGAAIGAIAGAIIGNNTGSGNAGDSRAATAQIAEVLAPLGIEYRPDKGGPGPDVGPLAAKGAAWAWLAQDGEVELIPAPTVHAVDTNGAGDTHAGVLCAALAVGRTMRDAVRLANVAAAISVTREGPATSPTVEELGEALTGSAGV